MSSTSRLRPFWLPLFLLAACGGDAVRAFPEGVAPLDPVNLAALPEATADAQFPEQLNTVTGTDEENDWEWAHAQGYVHASVVRVFAALQVPDVIANRRKLASWSVTPNAEEGYDVSFRLRNTSKPTLGITQTFELTWRFAVTEGTLAEPIVVNGRSRLTDGPEAIMRLIEDSVVLTAVDESTTRIELMRHLSAYGQDADSAALLQRDLFDSVVAYVHGRPLPSY